MWNDTELPLAYLITFRTYGTWLHGDTRGSTSRHRNIYNTKHLPREPEWQSINRSRLAEEPLRLDKAQRTCVEAAIKDTCRRREWIFYGANARTTHVHTVAGIGATKPAIALNAFKANATRSLREALLHDRDRTPWADKGSERWLWTRVEVNRATDYVLYGQGDDFLNFE